MVAGDVDRGVRVIPTDTYLLDLVRLHLVGPHCRYDLRTGDLFVLSWAMVQQVRRRNISSELLMCGEGDGCCVFC